ncbi:MAG: CTP synthase [Candidatus Nanoarchaeia archaeon]
MANYIFIFGGGYSGLGKGVVTASIANLLKRNGYNIKIIKIDPYFNFGAGDQNPNEHGEVFVTEDGGEVDQDFGHYERFTAISCLAEQNITSGKIFWSVINKGLKGRYLGKTIQLIPHVRDEVKRTIYQATNNCDFAIVEIGGTIGDDESLIFIRAIASMIYEDNVKAALIVLVPLIYNESVGEPKTKIAQNAIRTFGEFGLKPDFLILRTSTKELLDEKRKNKLQIFCNMKKECIFNDPDLSTPYLLPKIFSEQNLDKALLEFFNLPQKIVSVEYEKFITKLDQKIKIPIAYIGKYIKEGEGVHKDAYISVEEALKRACIEHSFLPEIWRIDAENCENSDLSFLKNVGGIIIPGGYGSRGFEGKIAAIKYARENKIPLLGLCLGLQLLVVEFARNVCGIKEAHTDEQDEEIACKNPAGHVVCALPEQEKIRAEQGFINTQRLGDFAYVVKDPEIKEIYEKFGRPDICELDKIKKYPKFRLGKFSDKDFVVIERHRHRREINPTFIDTLIKNGLKIVGSHETVDGTLLIEAAKIEDLPIIATQFHPEFTSNFLRPNPYFYWFADKCKERALILKKI